MASAISDCGCQRQDISWTTCWRCKARTLASRFCCHCGNYLFSNQTDDSFSATAGAAPMASGFRLVPMKMDEGKENVSQPPPKKISEYLKAAKPHRDIALIHALRSDVDYVPKRPKKRSRVRRSCAELADLSESEAEQFAVFLEKILQDDEGTESASARKRLKRSRNNDLPSSRLSHEL
eukprot:GILJ01004234.1.p1 GENE.GILJ01004234.1~~GILJ01004234.1.p1  ORF type:complete len:179 (-),score=14.35 GILJ01004234.1:198-734(-)